MSVLTWLFALGGCAIAFPLLFHLIRRMPKGHTPFSSLMFLDPSPPTLTRRSRFENLLLLFLRCAAIGLLAFAFMRPFLRDSNLITADQLPGKNVIILVDTSASMRRGDLWKQAQDKITDSLASLNAQDQIAFLAFDKTIETVVDFNKSPGDNSGIKSQIRSAFQKMEPSWSRSDLGGALVAAARRIESIDGSQSPTESHIIVISDLQDTSSLNALQSYVWPAEVRVELASVKAKDASNATFSMLDDSESTTDDQVRVRIENPAGSEVDQFSLKWSLDSAAGIPIYIPPGTSHVASLRSRNESTTDASIEITGDRHEFDDTFYVAQPIASELTVAYLGDESANDPERKLFYLKRALFESARRRVTLNTIRQSDSLPTDAPQPTLLVVTRSLTEAEIQNVRRYLEQGGTAFVIADQVGTLTSCKTLLSAALVSQVEPASETGADDYSLLSFIDFGHPIFKPLSGPRYGDFTGISVWRHLDVDLDESAETTLLARFDDGSPAVWTRKFGQGNVIAMSFGWQPDASQLSLSTKFLPLMNSVLDFAHGRPDPPLRYTIDQPLPISVDAETTVLTPDGTRTAMQKAELEFRDTTQPGIYTIEVQQFKTRVAVNMDRLESSTGTLEQADIESLGVPFGDHESAESIASNLRAKKDVELERGQKLWKWLILCALGLILSETWLAGRTESKLEANQATEMQES